MAPGPPGGDLPPGGSRKVAKPHFLEKDRLRRRWRGARHSLGARLTGLFLLLAVAMTLTFVAGMQAALRFGWQDYARPLIANYIDTLAAEIGTPPDVAKARALTQRLPLRIRIEGPAVNWSSHPADRHDAWRARQRRGGDGDGSTWQPVRELADGHRIAFGLASPLRDDAPEDRPRLIGWGTLAALLALIALAYALVRRLLRPLADIRAGAIRYGGGDFSRPIPARGHDELGDLAQQINGMADGLHHLLDAKRQLLLAISHELRSPLTRARLNAELVAEGGPRDALLNDLAQMRDLITDLLESERLAAGHAALHTEPCDLNALVRDVVGAHFSLHDSSSHDFPERDIDLALDATLPPMPLDATRVKLLLRNLLDNAVRHSAGAEARPQLRTQRDGDMVRLIVRDHGVGVDDAHLPHLAEAFYRADAARQRATGGVGLGLYLCRLVVQAHGGALTIRNAQPGLEIEVTLPVVTTASR
jgi:signal transduction histidine kinase